MAGLGGINVHEGNIVTIFINFVAGDFAFDDFSENRIAQNKTPSKTQAMKNSNSPARLAAVSDRRGSLPVVFCNRLYNQALTPTAKKKAIAVLPIAL